MLDVKRCAEGVLSSWVVMWGTVLTYVCMLRYWMRNVVPGGGCNGTVMRFSACDARLRNSAIHVAYSREPQSMRHMRPDLRNPYGIYSQSSATHAAYTAGVPQSMRYIRRGLRNLYYATIYPTEIYKVPFDTFRLSVELPIQKHTDTS